MDGKLRPKNRPHPLFTSGRKCCSWFRRWGWLSCSVCGAVSLAMGGDGDAADAYCDRVENPQACSSWPDAELFFHGHQRLEEAAAWIQASKYNAFIVISNLNFKVFTYVFTTVFQRPVKQANFHHNPTHKMLSLSYCNFKVFIATYFITIFIIERIRCTKTHESVHFQVQCCNQCKLGLQHTSFNDFEDQPTHEHRQTHILTLIASFLKSCLSLILSLAAMLKYSTNNSM